MSSFLNSNKIIYKTYGRNLSLSHQVVGGKVRKYCLATKAGKAALTEALAKVRELMNEVDDQSQ